MLSPEQTATDLTSKYALIFRNPAYLFKYSLSLCRAAYRSGKLTELLSFAYWEVKHRLRLYRPAQYIQFNNTQASYVLDSFTHRPDEILLTDQCESDVLTFSRSSIDWKVVYTDQTHIMWGATYKDSNVLVRKKPCTDTAAFVWQFPSPIKSTFITSSQIIFVCTTGTLYRSANQGATFEPCIQFASSISYFLFNNGMTELPDGTLLIGEYGSLWAEKKWQNLSYVYSSTDHGTTWQSCDFLIRTGSNKHVHLVKYSYRLNAVFLTDGDNKKRLWINTDLCQFNQQAKKNGAGWQLINFFHVQTGGYTAMVDGSSTTLFGTDYLGGTNFIVRTDDGETYLKQVISDPYRRSPIMNMVVRQTDQGKEIWAILHNSISSQTRCLLMYTKDEGKTWHKVIEYDGTMYEIQLIHASAVPTNSIYIVVITTLPSGYCRTVYEVS